jgi:hypothetical protein
LALIDDSADSLLTLPLSVLSRALAPMLTLESFQSTVDRGQLFAFLVRCLDHYGPSASVLFRDLSVDSLTAAELSILHSHTNFQWYFIGRSAGEALIRLIAESEKQRLALSALSDRESGLIAGLESRVSVLGAQIELISHEREEKDAVIQSQLARMESLMLRFRINEPLWSGQLNQSLSELKQWKPNSRS